MKNKIIIFIFLTAITLLLLELPKQYYSIQDEKLFTEQGTYKYDTAITKTVNDFSFKLQSFFTYMPSSPTNGIGYTNELSIEEISALFPELMNELDEMTGGEPENIISELKLSSAKKQCFTAQIFQLIEDEQFIWEVGFLEFYLPNSDVFGRIIYDTDTYKIIMAMWFGPKVDDYSDVLLTKPLNGSAIFDYYSTFSKEIYVQEYPEYIIIYPFPLPLEEVEKSSLYGELIQLADYFWYNAAEEYIFTEIENEMQQ